MNQDIREELKTKIPVVGFGASDCKENCKSHLLFFSDVAKEKVLVKKIVKCARLMSDHVFVINVR